MNLNHTNGYGELDRIRLSEGAERCRDALDAQLRRDVRGAAALLNDRRLLFPSLYILRDRIPRHIRGYLSPRNTTALRMMEQVENAGASGMDAQPSRQGAGQSVFKWILETGSAQEIPEDTYEEMMELSASALLGLYRDADALPPVLDLIFKRNRDGRYIHDLVWALFCFHDPRVLKLLAERLRSPEPKDAALAAELLNLDEMELRAGENDRDGRASDYLRWLEENLPYLYFTEESFQYAGRPQFCAVDLERKYLQKGEPSYDRRPLSPADDEKERLAEFRRLGAQERKRLSAHSQKIHDESVPAWKEWLHMPVGEQLQAASSGTGGEE